MNRTVSYAGRPRPDVPSISDAARGRVRVRTVALPTEHGGWSLTLEPVVLGLLVAPSPAGCFLALATVGAFLARHPLKIVLGDRRRGWRFPRTAAAERFLLLYGGIAFASALAAATTAVSYAFLLPLLAALPLASIQLTYDATGRGRSLLPELAGSLGLAAVSASIALADGWPLAASLGLWAVVAGRVAPSILYVRARLRRLHGESPSPVPTLAAHVAALGLTFLLARAGVVPPLAAAALLILLLRAAAGLQTARGRGSAKRVGVGEVFYGAMTVLAVAVGRLSG